VDAERAQAWSDDEVLRRWTKLYTGPELVQQYLRGGAADLSTAQLEAVQAWAATYRARLGDLSRRWWEAEWGVWVAFDTGRSPRLPWTHDTQHDAQHRGPVCDNPQAACACMYKSVAF